MTTQLIWLLIGAAPILVLLYIYKQAAEREIRNLDDARKAAKALAIKSLEELVVYNRFYDLVNGRHGNASVLLGDAREILAAEKRRRIEG